MMSSPPGIQLRAEVRIEKSRRDGDSGMTSASSSMAVAAATDSRRRRSTSKRREEAPITSAGSATNAASHSLASLILIAFVEGRGSPCRQNGVAQPTVETRQQSRQSGERLDHDTVENVVEEPSFERDQEEPSTRAIRPKDCERDH